MILNRIAWSVAVVACSIGVFAYVNMASKHVADTRQRSETNVCYSLPQFIETKSGFVRIVTPPGKALWVCQDGTLYLKQRGNAT